LVAEALELDIAGDDDETAARKAIDRIRKLGGELGLPSKLSEVGVPEDGIEAVTEDSMVDGCMFNNPGEPEFEEVEELFRQAY
ncbi:MAG TPA: iron-containing alcohol dehydrogenase, partial [Candidatus Limnocylindrales bacterium]